MTAPILSQPSSHPSHSSPPSHGAGVLTSALALAVLLGFGLGVTFQTDREHVRLQAAPPQAQQTVAPAPRAPAQALAPVAAPPAHAVATEHRVPPPAPAAEAVAPPPPAVAQASVAPPPPPAPVAYAYVFRYEKGGSFAYEIGSGKFENVAAARAAVIGQCQRRGGRNCKFNYAPAGNCIAVARPPYGPFRVSVVAPDQAAAAANALSQCAEEHSSGCAIDKMLCSQP